MHIIKLNAIDSTNSYLKELSAKQMGEDNVVQIGKWKMVRI